MRYLAITTSNNDETTTNKERFRTLIERFVRNIGSILKEIMRRCFYQTKKNDQPFVFNKNGNGFPQRRCNRVKREYHPEAVFVIVIGKYM